MENKYDLIVLGAGSGGLTAAIGGANIGAKVLLIEKDKIGGDCTHYGCVPSKALIKYAKDFSIAKSFNNDLKVNLPKILEDVKSKVDFIYSHESVLEIEKFGIDVKIGSAKFISKNSIEVNGEVFFAKKFVISTGGRARTPQILGIENVKVLTNKEIFLKRNFKSLAVIGSGPIGSELSNAFSNLGIEVTIIERGSKILGREDDEASKLLEDNFLKSGIKIFKNMDLKSISNEGNLKKIEIESNIDSSKKSILVDEVLVSVGRVPNIENLGLEVAGIDFDLRGIFINSKTQTSNKNVFAIGDVARGFQFTHFANHQGKIALANIIFKLPFKYETKVIPRVTFTTPEIASVGLSSSDLIKDKLKENIDFFVLKKDYSQIDRAITDGNTNGFFKIIVDKKGLILGAVLVGSGSGELIGEISLAMKNKISISKLSDTIHPYPTYGYGLRNCADQFRAISFTENKKKWIKRIFMLNGN